MPLILAAVSAIRLVTTVWLIRATATRPATTATRPATPDTCSTADDARRAATAGPSPEPVRPPPGDPVGETS